MVARARPGEPSSFEVLRGARVSLSLRLKSPSAHVFSSSYLPVCGNCYCTRAFPPLRCREGGDLRAMSVVATKPGRCATDIRGGWYVVPRRIKGRREALSEMRYDPTSAQIEGPASSCARANCVSSSAIGHLRCHASVASLLAASPDHSNEPTVIVANPWVLANCGLCSCGLFAVKGGRSGTNRVEVVPELLARGEQPVPRGTSRSNSICSYRHSSRAGS